MTLPFFLSSFNAEDHYPVDDIYKVISKHALRIFSFNSDKKSLYFLDSHSMYFSQNGEVTCLEVTPTYVDGGFIVNEQGESYLVKAYALADSIFAFNIDGTGQSFFAIIEDCDEVITGYSMDDLLTYFFNKEAGEQSSTDRSAIKETYTALIDDRRIFENAVCEKSIKNAFQKLKRRGNTIFTTILAFSVILFIVGISLVDRSPDYGSDSVLPIIFIVVGVIVPIIALVYRFIFFKESLCDFKRDAKELARLRLFGHKGELDYPYCLW